MKSLIKRGAILTMADGYRVIVADAMFNGHLVWWFEAFGREHILQADRLQRSGPWTQIMSGGQTIIATIGPLEGEEDSTVWRAWKKFLQTEGGRHVAASIAELKAQAANARE